MKMETLSLHFIWEMLTETFTQRKEVNMFKANCFYSVLNNNDLVVLLEER